MLVYGVSNRGGRALGTGMINVTTAQPAGDGFPYNTGHVYVASGWQGDLVFSADPNVAAETISVPVAKNPDGSSVTSPTFARFVTVSGNTQSLPGRGRTPASLDTTKATLISIARETNVGVRTSVSNIASTDWAFADCRTVAFPGTPDLSRICLKNGFDPSLLYQFTFTAKDPLVLGVGLAAYRDVVSFPAVRQDIAVVVGEEVAAGAIIDTAREAAGPELVDARVFDVYRGEPVQAGRKSIAFSVAFQSPERTLTDEDAARLRTAIVEALERRFGAELRA